MSNTNTSLKDKILTLSDNEELFKKIALDLWTTLLAGAALIDLKNNLQKMME